jgi:hypothetical protein
MGDNIVKNDYDLNFPFIAQNQTVNTTTRTMSVVPQQSTRPSTLPINGQRTNDPLLFTPNDYNKLYLSTPEMDERLRGYTTPDLINALTTQAANDGQPSPGAKILDEIFTTHVNNNNRSILPPTNSFDPVTNRFISNSDHQKQENLPTYDINRRNSQTLSRNRSISSSMNDYESSNSATPSSPLSTYQHKNRVKDELQHVPSMGTNPNGEPKDVVKKEKKRERNRQAAQKCRTRKLTRIAELQKRVNELQGKNKDLTGIAEFLKSDITKLEKQLEDHHTQGCTLMNGSIL